MVSFVRASQPGPRRLQLEWLLCLALVLAGAAALRWSGAAERIDLGLHDAWLRLDARPAGADIAIVAIDDTSLAQEGRWPWPRERQAALLRALAGAAPRAVAIDILYVEPAADPAADAALAQALGALARQGPVFLPVTAVTPLAPGRPAQALPPLPLLEQAASGLGHIHVVQGRDAVVRGLHLAEGLAPAPWPALGLRLAAAVRPELAGRAGEGGFAAVKGVDGPGGLDGTGWVRGAAALIPFSGPAGHYPTIPAAALLRGELPPGWLQGRLVLVGLTAAGAGDHYPTPFSAGTALVPGVEVNAAVADALLAGRMLRPLPAAAQWALGAAFLLGWMALLWRLGPRAGLLALPLVALAMLAAAALLHLGPRLVWQPAAWLAGALGGYVLWNWRRLAVLLAELNWRAAALGAGEALDGSAQGRAGGAVRPSADSWTQVLHALDLALAARHQRAQTLQFLSHDLRAPQSAILALLQSDAMRGQPQVGAVLRGQLSAQVETTLRLAHGFADQLRAEGADYALEDVELGLLLEQVRERALPLARPRRVALTCIAPGDGEGFWVRADPALLDRALFNLVDNAIKYGREGGACVLEVAWAGAGRARRARLTVSDDGPGIAPEDLPRLFGRYQRLASGQAAAQGQGLGLFFVKTVVGRLGGSVGCESQPGRGTRFTIELPEAPDEGATA